MNEIDVARAASLIHQGGIVAHACEGVWGLACDPFCERAVRRILALKARSEEKGLIVIGADPSYFDHELSQVSASTRLDVMASWPGHITWILPTTRFPVWICGRAETVACRVPDHQLSRELATTAAIPLVSTSANLSGRSPLRTQVDVEAQFGHHVDFVLPSEINVNSMGPSKIFDARTGKQLR